MPKAIVMIIDLPKIPIHPVIYKVCSRFAERVVKTTQYLSERGQSNEDRIIRQTLIGKLGEFGAYYYLGDFFEDISSPDLSVVVNGKSHGYDLLSGEVGFVVKSSDGDEPFRNSWTFQRGHNPDPIFSGKTDGYFVGTTVRTSNSRYEIDGEVEFRMDAVVEITVVLPLIRLVPFLNDKILSKTFSPRMESEKRVVRFDDMLKQREFENGNIQIPRRKNEIASLHQT